MRKINSKIIIKMKIHENNSKKKVIQQTIELENI